MLSVGDCRAEDVRELTGVELSRPNSLFLRLIFSLNIFCPSSNSLQIGLEMIYEKKNQLRGTFLPPLI